MASGQGPCDSLTLGPVRKLLEEYFLKPDSFADTEAAVVDILRTGTARDERQIHMEQSGEVPVLPPERPSSKAINMQNAKINHSYCF